MWEGYSSKSVVKELKLKSVYRQYIAQNGASRLAGHFIGHDCVFHNPPVSNGQVSYLGYRPTQGYQLEGQRTKTILYFQPRVLQIRPEQKYWRFLCTALCVRPVIVRMLPYLSINRLVTMSITFPFQYFTMAEIRAADRGEIGDCGQFNRSVLVPRLRDYVLCLYHEQEAPVPPIQSCGPCADHSPLLLSPWTGPEGDGTYFGRRMLHRDRILLCCAHVQDPARDQVKEFGMPSLSDDRGQFNCLPAMGRLRSGHWGQIYSGECPVSLVWWQWVSDRERGKGSRKEVELILPLFT